MLSLFKQRSEQNHRVAIWPLSKAIAMVHVNSDRNGNYELKLCELHPCAKLSDRAKVLKKICQSHQLKKYPCVSLMPSDMYSLHIMEAPPVPPEEIAEAMRWRVKDMIDYPIDDAVIDVFDVPDQQSSVDMVYVVCARKSEVKKQADMLLAAGFNLEQISITEIALRNIASVYDPTGQGMALIDLGSEGGSVTLSKDGVLYFTRHLLAADALFGSHYTDQITPSMESWLDRVVVDVQRSLDYYESQYSQPATYSVKLVPLAKPIIGTKDYLEKQLGMDLEYLDIAQVFKVEDIINPDIIRQCLPVIGAALPHTLHVAKDDVSEEAVEA